MGSITRQQAMKAAVSSVLLVLGTAVVGCDKGGGTAEDLKASRLVNHDDFLGASKERQANPLIVSYAASVAANEQYAQALPTYRKLVDKQLLIAQTMWQLNGITGQVQQIVDSGKALAKYDPQTSIAQIDKTVEAAKGANTPTWSPDNSEAAVPTIAASTATLNKLKDSITEVERNITDLKEKRDAASQQSQDLFNQSASATGQKSVDLFKQASQAKKLSSDLQVQIDQAELSLVPLKQDLSVAQEQAKLVSATVTAMSDAKDALEKAWRGVSAQSRVRQTFAASVYGNANTPKEASTILTKSRQLDDLLKEYQTDSDTYEQQLQAALTTAQDATTAAERAGKDITTIANSQTDKSAYQFPAYKMLQQIIDPSGARYYQSVIEFALGSDAQAQTAIYTRQAQLAEQVAAAANLVSATPAISQETARQNQQKAAEKAAEKLKAAADNFQNVSEAMLASAPTKQAASIGQIAALHASALVALDTGKAGEAREFLSQAKALRDKLAETNATLPNLPGDIQTATPATAPVSIEKTAP